MKKFPRLTGLALLGLLPFALSASASTLADDLTDALYTMRSVYRTGYAPAAWKKQYAGYDLNASFAEATQAVEANPSLTQQEGREILNRFIYSMRDYHTSIMYVSTETASLPITFQAAEGRYFIGYIDRAKLSESAFPFQIGDELIGFDGAPAAEAVAELQSRFVENVAATDERKAALSLSSRQGARGMPVPKGPVTLSLRRQGESTERSVQLLWDYTPEKIARRGDLQSLIGPTEKAAPSFFRPQMKVELAESPVAAGNPFGIGARKTFTPDLGAKMWESEETNTFYAYIYKTPDRRLIGYLRLPSYVPEDYNKAVADFAAILARMEPVTDGLVIDQVNNPGGSVFYLYTLASMFAEQPLRTPRHRMAITQTDVQEALTLIEKYSGVKNDADAQKILTAEDLNGYPASYEFVQFSLSAARFVIAEWEAGRKLSTPSWIGGVDHINPAATRYTKPVLLLVNHLDFSGGDFFPSILQDNRRATIMGSRTAGAGGYVLDVKVPNNLGIASFRYTGSIAERVDGNPIENLGVTPDVPYEISAQDLQQGYGPYKAAIQAEIDRLTK